MLRLANKLVRFGLDLVFGKPEPFEFTGHTAAPRCPNCQRPYWS